MCLWVVSCECYYSWCLQVGTQLLATQCEAAADAVLEALQQQRERAEELQAAQAAVQEPDHQGCLEQQMQMQQQLKDLKEQIRQLQRSIEGNASSR
jgi:hypothetical protein